MNRTPVSSTNVASVGYDAATLTLEVEFHSGSIYNYFDVPEAVFREFVSSDSVGGYLNQHIKNSYRYVQL